MRWISLFFIFTLISTISCNRVFDSSQSNEIYFFTPKFTDSENQKMAELLNAIPINIRDEFDIKYAVWKDTWDWEEFGPCSNPRCWAQSDQYAELLNFCNSVGNAIWPLIFVEHLKNEKEYLTSLLIEDVTLPEYDFLIESVRADIQECEDKIWEDFWIYYIQGVLKTL